MQSTKIQLSPQHIALVTNAQWILTKNEILQHIKTVFEELHQRQQHTLKLYRLPHKITTTCGKISRGENYLGLPWLVLDYPRHFVKNQILAIRTLFWWGRFFSTTLHLSGNWQHAMKHKLVAAHQHLQAGFFKLSYRGDEWVHDVHNTISYEPLSNFDKNRFEEILTKAPFIKVAACVAIEQIENAAEVLMQQFEQLLGIIADD